MAATAGERIFEILDTPSAVQDAPDANPLPAGADTCALKMSVSPILAAIAVDRGLISKRNPVRLLRYSG